jgi:hypothetical protein
LSGEVTRDEGEKRLREKAGRPKKGEECSGARTFQPQSETKEYQMARLDRDRPDLAARKLLMAVRGS